MLTLCVVALLAQAPTANGPVRDAGQVRKESAATQRDFVMVDPFATGSRDGGAWGFGATGTRAPSAAGRLGAAARGSLSKEEVKAGLLPQLSAIRGCYDASLKSDGPQSGGLLQVFFVIGVKGEVEEAGVERAGPGLSQALQRCVVEAVRQVKTAPPSGGVVRVVYPFTFSPGE